MFAEKLQLVWSDGHAIDVELLDNTAAQWYARCVKNLRHVPLEFNERSNPLFRAQHDRTLEYHARRLGVAVDPHRLQDQSYLNDLHEIYLQRYQTDPRPEWLDFHDALHALEDLREQNRCTVWLDYGHRAGPLIRPFDRGLLADARSQFQRGDCVITAHELGKTFWHYWRDGEPLADIPRICDLVPPWRFLKPVLDICYRDPVRKRGHLAYPSEFRRWVQRIQEPWSRHWGMTDWSIRELDQVLPVGRVTDIDACVDRFARGDCPERIRLPV